VAWYEELIGDVIVTLNASNHATAVAALEAPDRIRGYEEIKLRNVERTQAEVAELMLSLRAGVSRAA
jgi:hypothetical protein